MRSFFLLVHLGINANDRNAHLITLARSTSEPTLQSAGDVLPLHTFRPAFSRGVRLVQREANVPRVARFGAGAEILLARVARVSKRLEVLNLRFRHANSLAAFDRARAVEKEVLGPILDFADVLITRALRHNSALSTTIQVVVVSVITLFDR